MTLAKAFGKDLAMVFYYIRHGDPIYNPDSLTPLGKRQAEAVGRWFCRKGLDRIYSSTSQRAIDTATPASEMLKKPIELLDFANENHAWRQLTYMMGERRTWVCDVPEMKSFFRTPEIMNLGFKWYEHPRFEGYDYAAGLERIQRASDEFFATLGYEHDTGMGRYKATNPTNERVALFAHAGFGIAFLSCVLDIPYTILGAHLSLRTTGVTAISFNEGADGYAVPVVQTFNSEAHLLLDNLPVNM